MFLLHLREVFESHRNYSNIQVSHTIHVSEQNLVKITKSNSAGPNSENARNGWKTVKIFKSHELGRHNDTFERVLPVQ
jgi:hypothetical protein